MKLALAVPVPGSARLTSPTLRFGSGPVGSVMVPVPMSRITLPRLGLVMRRLKVSAPSAAASALTATVTTLLVSPGAKVTVPLVAAKSLPAWALPFTVA